ncbi:MAG: hypothetical protein ABI600_06760 [Luteolibacter sp.]
MIKGLDTFRERFRDFPGSLVLIGGAACDDWFTRQGLEFRATKDLDIVLLLEAVNPDFVAAMRKFIDDGGYEIRQRNEGGDPILYRFAKPADARFPAMLEIFSRVPDGILLRDDQGIVPIPANEEVHSLSAILVDDAYYALIREHSEDRDGIAFATATALIPLKAHAWLDLTKRLAQGEPIDFKNIAKHRADVFRLAGTLPGTAGPELSQTIRDDVARFIAAFPESSPDWQAILSSLKATLGGNLKPATLRTAIQTYFRIS